jgi:hypothetical protein
MFKTGIVFVIRTYALATIWRLGFQLSLSNPHPLSARSNRKNISRYPVTVIQELVFFRRVRKIAKSDNYLRHVRLFVRKEELGSHWTDFD